MTDRGWTEAMRAERYEDAWAIEQAVLAARDPATRDDPRLPYHQRWVWDGRALDGCDVLVRCYHGLGDTLQFARFLPALAARVRSVTLEAPARLHALLRFPGVTLAAFDPAHPLPPAERDVEITELCSALRLSPRDAPAPYLHVAPAPLPAATIGLCWQAGDWDADRWIAPDLLAPIAAQHRCLSLVSAPTDLPVVNPQGCPFDLPATAALVAGCALVVTVDTMIAHLAGALGRPTWLLLKAAPDWRWNPARTDSAWYGSIRLYPQPAPGDWATPLAAVARDLAAFEGVHHGQSSRPVGARLLG
ncbi:hypothetical protein J2Y58_000039 [Sphingomonas sp. BE138]|uniref:glycosyltransferase family 9 protein n=1 Tax=Sphingomonas sp. BE138 TaxID=2817845 RepID=UPI00285F08C6|nr:glycosyltransferase family 9 protein [Sphingomonas sp. BE138]MDR6786701.1 hypothetical protein [Sphingomonas sp. BE138]